MADRQADRAGGGDRRTGGGVNGSIDRTTRLLGFAGLLPQAALLAGLATGHDGLGVLHAMAFVYGALIFSFLGGIWWGWAVRRSGGQGALAGLAVAPTLVTILLVGVALHGSLRWALVGLGSGLLLTLLVDRHLVATGEAPAGWMRLRVPLSVGLGALTILTGVV
ncbi:hypothetical protein ASG67_08645 [Sphingomonas sp. Leaf339]|nr:hypothetical protein ASG67_08645 [Sphingomonas sp. Leaf339]